jgi:hypothetical protein
MVTDSKGELIKLTRRLDDAIETIDSWRNELSSIFTNLQVVTDSFSCQPEVPKPKEILYDDIVATGSPRTLNELFRTMPILINDIKENGLIFPITVEPMTDGKYKLKHGYKRLMAYCLCLGHKAIPALVLV